jgi:hypothetical protein
MSASISKVLAYLFFALILLTHLFSTEKVNRNRSDFISTGIYWYDDTLSVRSINGQLIETHLHRSGAVHRVLLCGTSHHPFVARKGWFRKYLSLIQTRVFVPMFLQIRNIILPQ